MSSSKKCERSLIKRISFSKKRRSRIAEKTNNRCGYCGQDLKPRWHVDHIKPIEGGGTNDFDNLIASCPQCNNYKHSHSLETFRYNIKTSVKKAREYSVNFRFAEKYKLIEETDRQVKFYFEELREEGKW